MPATMTHQMFALNIIDALKETYPILGDKTNILLLATQGPDPFFFYRTLPWQHAKDTQRIRNIGGMLHHQNPSENLHKLYLTAKKSNDDDLIAYMIGAIMHYILDKYVHPYVFSCSGFSEDGSLQPPYHIYHSHMETLMDIALKTHWKFKIKNLHPAKNITLNKKVLLKIDELYRQSYPEVVVSKDFYKAAKDMQHVYAFVFDRFAVKRKLIKLFLGKHSHAYAITHPTSLQGEEDVDVLNTKHLTWYHTETRDASNEDVMMLMARAKKDMIEIIHEIFSGSVDFSKWTNGINYDGLTHTGKHTHQTALFPLWRVSQ